jgi:NAD(P)-dependent dehydrogenase (short-subunit alcohol dehydrogenase family)
MGWLTGKTARLVGTSPAIAAALTAQGAALVEEGDCDVLVHVAPPPADVPAHEITFDQWRATLDAGLDQRFLLAKDFAALRRAAHKGGAVVFVGAPEQALGADQAAAGGGLGNLTKTLGRRMGARRHPGEHGANPVLGRDARQSRRLPGQRLCRLCHRGSDGRRPE